MPQLALLLDDPELHIAGKAATVFSLLGAEAFHEIEELLRDGTPQQRWGATIALYQTDADIERFLPALTAQLGQDDRLLVRASQAALSRLGARSASAVPALRATLAIDDAEIRWAALHALGAIGPAAQGVVPDVLPFLDDEAPELRLAAATAVRQLRPPAPISDERLATHIDWVRDNVPRLMQEHHVPGVSIAIIHRGQDPLGARFRRE